MLKFLGEKFPREPKICKILNEHVYFSENLPRPYRPIIGTLGVAPHPEEESLSSSVLPGGDMAGTWIFRIFVTKHRFSSDL